MSKVVIQGNASGTGDFTIAAPNSDTNRTLTLPDVAVTVLTSGSNADFPAGSVFQVVNGSTSTAVTSTATGVWFVTGITATISPTSATHNIMVIINLCRMHRSYS